MASAVLGVVSLFAGYRQAKKARKAESKARELEQRRAELETVRQQRQVREASRKQRASLIAQGVSSGAAIGSSSVQGAVGSLGTQTGEAIGFSQQQVGFAKGITNSQSAASAYQSKSGDYNALGGLLLSNSKEIGAAFSGG